MPIFRLPTDWPSSLRGHKRGNVYAADVRVPNRWGDRVVASVDVEDGAIGFEGEPELLTSCTVKDGLTPAQMRDLATILREAADAAERYEAHACADNTNLWEVSRV